MSINLIYKNFSLFFNVLGIEFYLTPKWEKLFTMKVIRLFVKAIKYSEMTLKLNKMVDMW